MLKTVVMTASLAAGLLMIDVVQPALFGNIAEAAAHRPVFRPSVRVAPRVTAKPRVNFTRPKSAFAKPKMTFRNQNVTKQSFQKSFQQRVVTPKQPMKANFTQQKKFTNSSPLQKANANP